MPVDILVKYYGFNLRQKIPSKLLGISAGF